jgi:hypothetical protein
MGFGEEDSAYHDWDNEQAKILWYGDVTLFLLPNPDGIRDLLGMEVDIRLRWPTLACSPTLPYATAPLYPQHCRYG